MRTFEYRLYPTRDQRNRLMACLVQSRALYNEMLERTKAAYKGTGKFLFKYDLSAAFKGRSGDAVPASTVQSLADRLDKALRRFLTTRKSGKPGGFPRFKTPNQWHSIHLRQYGKNRDIFLDPDSSRLRVPGKLGKALKIKLHRSIEGIPKTCNLVLRADGHWYALIVCEESPPTITNTLPDIGIDVGLRYFLTDSNGETVENPRFFRKSQATLRRKQRALCRCRRGSCRRRKAARNVAKTHLKIERQRKDFHHKTAKHYVDRYGRIFVEDLNVQGMLQNHHLAKSISDASWSAFFAILSHKAERAGGSVVEVPAYFTSQKCSGCGELVQKSLSVRTHVCSHCGLVADRDHNAARNILRAGAQPSEDNGGNACRSSRSHPL